MRLGSRVQPIDRLGRDRDGGVEAERVVRAREVVVDRLGNTDDRQRVLVMKTRGDAESVLSAYGDECLEPFVGEVAKNGLDPILHLVRVRPRRSQDRASAGQNSRDFASAERSEDALRQPLPAVPHRDHLVASIG